MSSKYYKIKTYITLLLITAILNLILKNEK